MQGTDPILSHFGEQADACQRLGSPFTAAVLAALAGRLAAGDPALDPVAQFPGDPKAEALALRVAGALHRIAMDGRDRRLARLYARADASLARSAAPLLSSALVTNRDLLETISGSRRRPTRSRARRCCSAAFSRSPGPRAGRSRCWRSVPAPA